MKAYILKITFCICLLIFPCICLGETSVEIIGFLSSAATDDSLLIENKAISFLNDAKDASFLDEVEFRVNVDEFENDKQKVALRFKTKSWDEFRSEERLNAAGIQAHQARHELLLNRAIKNRYLIIIDCLYCQETAAAYRDLAKMMEDRLKVLQKSAEISGVDPLKLSHDLAETENNLLNVQMELAELKNRMKLISYEIRRALGGSPAVPVAPVVFEHVKRVETNQILQFIQELDSLALAQNAALKGAEKDFELAAARYELEKSKNSPWFSFIETGYDLEQKGDFAQSFSVGFGIAVPFGASKRPEMKARELEKMKAKTACEIMKRQHQDNIIRSCEELRQTIHQYEDFTRMIQSAGNVSLYDLWRQTEGTDPIILLNLKELMLKNKISETKLLFQIYKQYIELLDIAGKLSEKPLKNYLSEEKEHYDFRL